MSENIMMACYAIPSARPVDEAWECFMKWARAGYLIAVWRDEFDDLAAVMKAADIPHIILTGKYPGYARTVNALSKEVLRRYPSVNWIVTGGDDTDPDPNWHPNHIALQLEAHFNGTFGICQPVGDRWRDSLGPIIDRIAGSPWIGRDWCRRAHAGSGPYFDGLSHMGVDDAIKFAAEREGVYLARPDLTHLHHHFTRTKQDGVSWEGGVPPHLRWCNTPEHWNEFQRTFEEFKLEYDSKWRPLPS